MAAAAYRSGERLTNERDGQTHDYSRRHGVEYAEVMAPDSAPDWMRDRERLWNTVEAVEKRKDAQLAREVEISLPRELTPQQRTELVREFVRDEFVSRGMVADVAIHCSTASDGREQPHAHVMLTTREIIPNEGFGGKNRDWNRTEALEGWRERWAEHQNRALERAGHEQRVDHRSLEAQRAKALGIANDNARPAPEREQAKARAEALDREPQPKLGVAAAAMERRGIGTDRGDQRRAVFERNDLRQQIVEIGRRVVEIGIEIAAKVRDAWEGLDLSGASRSVERARWAGLRLDAGGATAKPPPQTAYERSLDQFRQSARDIAALRADGLVPPLSLSEQHQRLADDLRRDLRDLAKRDPVKAWGEVKDIIKENPDTGHEIKKELARDLGKDKELMKELKISAPDMAKEISQQIGRSRSRGIGFSM